MIYKCQEIDCQGSCEMTLSGDVISGDPWLRDNWY